MRCRIDFFMEIKIHGIGEKGPKVFRDFGMDQSNAERAKFKRQPKNICIASPVCGRGEAKTGEGETRFFSFLRRDGPASHDDLLAMALFFTAERLQKKERDGGSPAAMGSELRLFFRRNSSEERVSS